MNFSALEAGLTGTLGRPGHEDYAQARTVWYPPARQRTPLASIRPATTQDVALAVNWARAEALRLSPRSGGHSFDGFPIQAGTVLLDFSQMRDTHLDADGVLHVQPGARAQAIAQALSPHERALPTGDCGTVALGGLLSGGGFGYLSRKLGLTIDSVVGATVVTGQGETLQVSAQQNPDLFWACRGGGGSAAIVTEFQIRSFPVDQVTGISLTYSWNSAVTAMLLFDQVLREAPRGLDLKLKLRTTGPDRFLDASSSGPDGCRPGTPVVEISGQFLGKPAQAEKVLAPLLEHAGLQEMALQEEGYFDAMLDLIPIPTLNDPAPESLRPLRVASDFTKHPLDRPAAEAIEKFIDELQHAPTLWGGCVVIEPCDGAVWDTPAAETAFPHRASPLLLQWELIHPQAQTEADIARLDRFLSNTRKRMSHLLSGGRYLNYADHLDTSSSWWGGNLKRLAAIADHHDPQRTILSRLHPKQG